MAKLLIDTCTWVDISMPKFQEVLKELSDQVNSGQSILLTCDIILEEWDRNKSKTIERIVTSIKDHAKSAEKLAALAKVSETAEIRKLLTRYKSIEKDQKERACNHIDKVEGLIAKGIKYQISDHHKITATDRAIKKLAPFHNKKNNMADALILLGAVDYVDRNYDIARDIFFISSNHTDFSSKSDYSSLHEDFDFPSVKYYNNLARALKMRTELVDLMDEYHEEKLQGWIDLTVDIAREK
jgi:hypothetical protein